jgi:hypothetical protein
MSNDEKDLVPITLRIPKQIHGRLKGISETEFRSLNHQIIMALAYFVEMQEKFGSLPQPDALRKALPDSAKGFPVWLKGTQIPTGRGSR